MNAAHPFRLFATLSFAGHLLVAGVAAVIALRSSHTHEILAVTLVAPLEEPQVPGEKAPTPAPEKPKPKAPAEKPEPKAMPSLSDKSAPAAPAAAAPAKPIGDGDAGAKQAAQASALSLYLGRVVSLLNNARVYPRDALSREESGIVTLLVVIAQDGTLVKEEVETPSPYASLNRAAEDTVKRVGKFPAPPADAPLTLHVPIHFKITSR